MNHWRRLGAACALVLALQPAWGQTDAVQVRSWAAACAGCHGTDGIAQPGMPTLAGVPRETLSAALRDFRDGRRSGTVMHQLARGYTDAQLEQIAAHFAALPR